MNENFPHINNYIPGQCYISSAETTLGVGIILKVVDRLVTVSFPSANESRNYATHSAPLTRLIHEIDSKVFTIDNQCYVIKNIIELNSGLVEYNMGDNMIIPESKIISAVDFNTPLKRLKQQHFDDLNAFETRLETLKMQQKLTSSNIRGLCGARVDLLPHQLYIAQNNSADKIPRILLADEVGLGKTIEAGLILHRLLAIGLVERALIIVPDALVHQWLVEMLRKFNLHCSLVTEDWLKVIQNNDTINDDSKEKENVFGDNQLIIASLDVITENSKIQKQMLNENFDIVIVDEAHKLRWDRKNGGSAEYNVIEKLTSNIAGLILLTATPEHFGYEGHFARLRLLNKERFFSLAKFIAECEQYQKTAIIADKLVKNSTLTNNEQKYLADIDCDPNNNNEALATLLNRHGLSNIMFRNSRKNMDNFPQREAVLEPLHALDDEDLILSNKNRKNYISQAVINYLVQLLLNNPEKKFLAICSTKNKATKIFQNLQQLINTNIAIFHEDMTIINRDRNGAYFADESESGAQLLICSEIGSEGRNFQFAHDLIMLDLVFDISLIEQRIGRLDRIGQTQTIKIHLPYLKNSIEECLVHWYHDGIGVFNECINADFSLLNDIKQQLFDWFNDDSFIFDKSKLTTIITETKVIKQQIIKKLEQGRDHLLELSSFNKNIAADIIDDINNFNKNLDLPQFMENILEFFGIKIDKLSRSNWQLSTDGMITDSLPDLSQNSDDITTVTFSRKTACEREDILFINSDSALLHGAIDSLLSSNRGNCCLTFLKDATAKGIMLEVVYLLQVIAPKELHIGRFLPATPLHIIIDSEDNVVNFKNINNGKVVLMPQQITLPEQLTNDIVPKMLDSTATIITKLKKDILNSAVDQAKIFFDSEVNRLEYLSKVNINISSKQINDLKIKAKKIENFIKKAQLNVEAMRLIISK